MPHEHPSPYSSPPFGYPPYGPYTESPQPRPGHYSAHAYGMPTPAPSPHTQSGSRRRSSSAAPPAHEYMSSSGKPRPSSSSRSRPPTSGHDYPEGHSYERQRSTTSPRPGTSHSRPYATYVYANTPLHTPPPGSQSYHPGPMPPHGTPMPNIYSTYGFSTPTGEFVSSFYPSAGTEPNQQGQKRRPSYPPGFSSSGRAYPDAVPPRPRTTAADNFFRTQPQAYPYPAYGSPPPGPTSPPPHEGRRSRTQHQRHATYGGEPTSTHSPRRSSSTKPAPPPRAATDPGYHAESSGTPKPPPMEPGELRRLATEQGIPSDYSLKYWNPKERPIILLGSVFDPNTLGEWVFNWTKYHHGRGHEATRTAGGFWELLIELSAKLRRAQTYISKIIDPEERETIQDFVDSGEKLWLRLKTLLKACEEYMWNGAQRVKTPKHDGGRVQMGKESGAEFVDAMFSGDKEWEKTERLMKGMATWTYRFGVNCEDILRRCVGA